jgi:hypothetical protein
LWTTCREARHVEPLEGELVEADQPLDLGVGEIALVRGPEDARLAALPRALGLHVERLVPAPRVDTHHSHPALEQPPGRLGGDAGAVGDVVGLIDIGVAARVDEDDVPLPRLARDAVGGVLRAQRLSVGPVGRIHHQARRQEPVQRQLVDRLRALAADRRVVVPRGVYVGRVVGPQPGERLHGPALAVAQQLGPDTEQRLYGLRARDVIGELDLGPKRVRVLLGIGADRR